MRCLLCHVTGGGSGKINNKLYKMKVPGSVRTLCHSLLSIMQWFDGYYEYLRSAMIKRRHVRCGSDEAEKFFISSSGNPVDNLKKLHDL